jgi:hypothetical protein
VPGLLATFWLVLAGISGAYLFYVVTDPDARLEKAFMPMLPFVRWLNAAMGLKPAARR